MRPELKHRIEQVRQGNIPQGYKSTKIATIPAAWELVQLKQYFTHLTRKNTICNTNVLTISAQYGLISQEDFFSKSVASENKENYFLLYRGDFAYNKSYSNGYPYGAIKPLLLYDEGIVSPLYICLAKTDRNKCPEFYAHYFEAGMLNHEIQAFAQEGARNHGLLNISVGDFFNAIIVSPPLIEQQKIAAILATQDKVIELKEKLLEEKQRQKKYLIQQFLTGKKRVPGFTEKWAQVKLSQILQERKEKKKHQNLRICSVSVQKGIVDQIEHLGRNYAASDTSNYSVAHWGDLVYTKSPTGNFPFGIIKQNLMRETVALSPLYGVFSPSTFYLGYFLNSYFESAINTRNYLLPIVQKGAKNTINITNTGFLSNEVYIPLNLSEQKAISQILMVADREIDLLRQNIEQEKKKKTALMQLLLTGIVRVKV